MTISPNVTKNVNFGLQQPSISKSTALKNVSKSALTKKQLTGVTLSKVSPSQSTGKAITKKAPVGPPASVSLIRPSSSTASAVAVASAKEILMKERSKTSPAAEAFAKLKSFRSSLPNALKRTAPTPAGSSVSAKRPAPAQAPGTAVAVKKHAPSVAQVPKASKAHKGPPAPQEKSKPPVVIDIDGEDVICID